MWRVHVHFQPTGQVTTEIWKSLELSEEWQVTGTSGGKALYIKACTLTLRAPGDTTTSETSLVAETDTKLLFMPRADFSPAHLTEDAMRMLKLNAKLYRPDDELLLTRHYQEQEWEHAKKHYVKSVLKESIDKRTSKALLSRNPALMRRSSVRHPLFG